MTKSVVRLAACRVGMSRELQALCFLAELLAALGMRPTAAPAPAA